MTVVKSPKTGEAIEVILYHGDLDGIVAAGVVLSSLPEEQRRRVLPIRSDYGKTEFLGGKIVDQINHTEIEVPLHSTAWVVDFSLPKAQVLQLQRVANVIWIDHHPSAIEKLESIAHTLPGMRSLDRSGCGLAWQFLHSGREMPDLVRYVEDRDLWRFSLGEATNRYTSGALIRLRTPWDVLPLLESNAATEEILTAGGYIEAYRRGSEQTAMTRFATARSFRSNLRVAYLNLPGNGDVGEALCTKFSADIAVCYVVRRNREISVSLYSSQYNVEPIARIFGGGGHAGAAGFSWRNLDIDAMLAKLDSEINSITLLMTVSMS